MTIKEYWNLIGREPFLAITWEPDFSQACSFCRMLMNHKNFHFTQIPDKTYDVIFLKSSKTMLLGHFWPFLIFFAQWGFFQKNLALSLITRYGPLKPCKVSEKTNEPILRKLVDRRKDGQTDGRTKGRRDRRTDRPYVIGPFRSGPVVKKHQNDVYDIVLVFLLLALNIFHNFF